MYFTDAYMCVCMLHVYNIAHVCMYYAYICVLAKLRKIFTSHIMTPHIHDMNIYQDIAVSI